MSMGILLSIIGLLWSAIAASRGSWAWLLAWVGTAFLIVGVAYLRRTPTVFGKRADGSLPIWRIVVLLPYLLLTWSIWHTRRLVSREPAYAEIEPGIYIGRRLTSGEWPEGTRTVFDLTSEFAGVHPPGDDGTSYGCLPTLDRCAPGPSQLVRRLRELLDAPRILYFHCAEGHGRSALAAAVFLLLRHESLDAEQAIARIRTVRPGAWLSAEQRAILDRAFSLVRRPPESDS